MRTLLILAMATAVAACGGEMTAKQRERAEQRASDEQAASDIWNFGAIGSGVADDSPSGDGPAGDIDAPDAGRGGAPAGQQSCAGMSDAEAFVRCLYEGIGSGALNTRDEPGGPAVFTDGTWVQTEDMRRMAPNWENIEMLCLCETPTQVRLRSVTITPGAGGTAEAAVVLSGTPNERPFLSLVREAGGWQVDDVTVRSGA